MNTFPFVLPYSPPAMGLVILFAIAIVFTDRMWRLQRDAVASSTVMPASIPLPTG
jgi:hypothetical protein